MQTYAIWRLGGPGQKNEWVDTVRAPRQAEAEKMATAWMQERGWWGVALRRSGDQSGPWLFMNAKGGPTDERLLKKRTRKKRDQSCPLFDEGDKP